MRLQIWEDMFQPAVILCTTSRPPEVLARRESENTCLYVVVSDMETGVIPMEVTSKGDSIKIKLTTCSLHCLIQVINIAVV